MIKKYQFKAGLFGTAIALIGTGVFVSLALWQLGRADEKRDLQALVEHRLAQPATEYTGGELDLTKMQYRQLRLNGRFENSHQVLLDNIVLEGKPGYDVITPFLLDNGSYVLVNRGWIAQGRLRDELPDINVDNDPLTITGKVEKHRSRPVIAGDSPKYDESNRWLYIDTRFYQTQSGLEVPDFVIRLAPKSSAAYRSNENTYDAKVGMHIGYAIQWAAFALIAFGTWLGLSFKRRDMPQTQQK